MKLSQTRIVRTATIDLGNGQSFEFKYRSLSPVEWDDLEQRTRGQFWQLVKELSELLVETGIEDDDGKQIAPTEENLRQIDLPILKAMMVAIHNTTLPKKVN